MVKQKSVTCEIVGNRVLCPGISQLLGHFGKATEAGLELALVEALYLLKKRKISLTHRGKKLRFIQAYRLACKLDERFVERYKVYEDLRERGYVVKTGLKYGCDFRVYERGVAPKRGPKSPKEHTKWIVFCVPEDYTCSFYELARAVRLAHNIRARMLWAIVDGEGDITYYEVTRIVP